MGRHNSPNWQEKCLMVIEEICAHKCIGIRGHKPDKCLPCELFMIAHVGTTGCGGVHKDWDKKVKKLWKELNT